MIARYNRLIDIRSGKYFVQSYTPGNRAIAQLLEHKKKGLLKQQPLICIYR